MRLTAARPGGRTYHHGGPGNAISEGTRPLSSDEVRRPCPTPAPQAPTPPRWPQHGDPYRGGQYLCPWRTAATVPPLRSPAPPGRIPVPPARTLSAGTVVAGGAVRGPAVGLAPLVAHAGAEHGDRSGLDAPPAAGPEADRSTLLPSFVLAAAQFLPEVVAALAGHWPWCGPCATAGGPRRPCERWPWSPPREHPGPQARGSSDKRIWGCSRSPPTCSPSGHTTAAASLLDGRACRGPAAPSGPRRTVGGVPRGRGGDDHRAQRLAPPHGRRGRPAHRGRLGCPGGAGHTADRRRRGTTRLRTGAPRPGATAGSWTSAPHRRQERAW
ncbi:hypothetical protein QJS66_19170 [Kocuria rhizophila]|nr:hypothetical protein QJS66_19170 [Kocuria rhizophila]